MEKTLLLVDAYSQIYRGFYAVRSLTNAKGLPSNAVFAMSKLLLKLQSEYPGCGGAFVFDKGRPRERLALAPQYKANRPPMPVELRSQMDAIRRLVGAFGWPIIESEGSEADDLIGAAVKKFSAHKILIVSSDKDISQVIDSLGRVEMLVPSHDGKGFSRRGAAETLEKFGVPPGGIVDYLALVGDASDNIPGVEGVGSKTAAMLLNEFGSIDALLAAPEKIGRESLRAKIAASGELLRLNRKLVALVCDVPEGLPFGEKEFERRPPDVSAILEIASEFSLKSLGTELEKLFPDHVPASAAEQGNTQMEFDFR